MAWLGVKVGFHWLGVRDETLNSVDDLIQSELHVFSPK